MHTSLRWRIWILLLGVSMGGAGVSRAQEAPSLVLAETLFQEGKRLMNAGDLALACPKLAESYRLDPAGGTLLALALCHEKQGKIATAWAEYRLALAQAQKKQRPERERVAREKIEALERILPRLTVRVPSPAPAALRVLLDGVELPEAAWNTPLPVDPGTRTLSATAPGFSEIQRTVQIPQGPSSSELQLPPLEPLPAPPVASASSAPPVASSAPLPAPSAPVAAAGVKVDPLPTEVRSPSRGSLALGFGVAGGVVTLGSLALGAYAWSSRSDARELCPSSPCSDARGLEANRSANRAATAANVAFGVGLVSLGAAAIFWWLDRDAPSTARVPGGFRF